MTHEGTGAGGQPLLHDHHHNPGKENEDYGQEAHVRDHHQPVSEGI